MTLGSKCLNITSKLPTPKTDDIIYEYILKRKKFIISVEYNDKIEIISMKEEIENKNLFH